MTANLILGCLLPFSAAVADEITAPTGVITDLAILGPGYFVVRDPDENLLYVTRRGNFQIDVNGYVATSDGLRLQGYCDPALIEIGDMHIVGYGEIVFGGGANGFVVSFSFQSDGRLLATLDDGSESVPGQVLLQNFGCPSTLRDMGAGYYALEQPALPLAQPLPPGTAGLGVLAAGELEMPVPTLQLARVSAQVSPSSQGVLYYTGNPTDLAIQGKGFFVVRDPTNNVLYATRAGAFYRDTNGYLVNCTGFRVQGFTNASSGVGDLQMDLIGYAPADSQTGAPAMICYVNHLGKISTFCIDGTVFPRGQILLRDCADPASLVSRNFGLYPLVEGAGLWTAATAPGNGGLGWVYQSTVEPSHFDEDILAARQSLNFFVQGSIQQTTNPTDVAISGLGLFMVRDPGSDLQFATRCGAFQVDPSGYLVTSNGFRLQGLNDAELSVAGDLVINTDGAPSTSGTNVTVRGFDIDGWGRLNVSLSDGTSFVRGQILLQWFANPQALQRCPNQLYSNVEEALPVFVNASQGTDGLGMLFSYALEDLTPPPELQLPPQTGLRLLVSSLFCANSVVETSTDCVQWTAFSQINNAWVGGAELFDTNIAQAPCRFYRVRIPFGSVTAEPADRSRSLNVK